MKNAVLPPLRKRSIPFRIAAIYAFIGGLWILFSDMIVAALAQDPAALSRLQTFKGWFYVAVTALILYALIWRSVSLFEKSEKALRESEEKFAALAEHSASAIFICREHFVFVNAAMEHLSGYSREELMSMNLYDLASPELRTMAKQCGEGYLSGDLTPARYEFTINTKTGEHRWIDFTISTIRYRGATAMVGTAFDITDRKRAEEELRHSEEILRTVYNGVYDAIFVHDVDGNIIDVNSRMLEMYGVFREQAVHMSFRDDYSSPDNPLDLLPVIWQRVIEGEEQFFEWKARRPVDSSVFAVEVSLRKLTVGARDFILATVRDITGRKHAEAALWEANRTLYSLIQASPLAIIALDAEGKITLWNPAAERIFGWSAQEVLGRLNPIVPEERQEEYELLRRRVFQGAILTGIELRRQRSDGSVIDVSLSTAPLHSAEGTIAGAIVLLSDITERKRAEAALRESEERYRIVAETALDAIITIDEESTMRFVNPAAERIFGYSAAELLGRPLTMLMPERMRARHVSSIRRHIATGKRHLPWEAVELPGLHKNGREVPLEISYGEFIKDGEYFFIGIARDITERKRAEDALRESERKYRELFEESKDAVYITTPDGRFLDINPAGIELFGYASKDELLDRDIARDIYVHPEQREEFKRLIAEQGYVKDFEVETRKRDGERLFILITGTAVRDEKGAIVAYRGFIRDITGQKRLEQQLIQSQKMEAIGNLAGGIAHDFNNILTAIISYGSLMQMTMKEDDPLQPYAEQVLLLADRAAHLTQSLLAFSRKQIMNPREVDLNEIIRKVEKLLLRLISEDIELRTILADKPLLIMADSVQIEQILMNLTTNARDALPEGGAIIISTSRREINEEFAKTHGFGTPGQYALLSFTDTGTGMDEQTRQKAFEPFFTTKEVGRGTGLGLSIVYGSIKQHNGYISLYSEPGKGTTFKVYFPLIRPKIEEQTPAEPAALKRGTETVLLAEDEAEVRKTTKTVLESLGYGVIEAADGEDALRAFYENEGRIQLLILDVVMPGRNGREVYDEIRKTRPDIKVLFTIGYTSDIMHKRGILRERLPFISKPYSPHELAKKTREVLEYEPAR